MPKLSLWLQDMIALVLFIGLIAIVQLNAHTGPF